MSDSASDHTKEVGKTQADSAGQGKDRASSQVIWEEAVRAKFNQVNEEMDYKERQALSVLDQNIPESYYRRWQSEANDLFALAVRLRLRSRKFRKGQRLINRKSSGYMGL